MPAESHPLLFLSAASRVVGVHALCFCGGGFEFFPRCTSKTVCLSLTLRPSSTFMAVSVVTFLQGCLGWAVEVVVGVGVYQLFQGPD